MKNTLENKAKFFAQYWGQEIGVWFRNENNLHHDMKITIKSFRIIRFLELTPLSMITDEDAVEVANIIGESNYPLGSVGKIEAAKDFINWFIWDGEYENFIKPSIWEKVIYFLRSKGYAVPSMGLSVEQQIEYGWIKLQER